MPPDQRLVARADVWCVEIDGTQVLYDPQNRRAHVLNASAGTIWALLQQPSSRAGLATHVVDEHGLDRSVAVRDVDELVGHLAAEGLVVAAGSTPPAGPRSRDERPVPDAAAPREADGRLRSRTMRIVDQQVVVASDDVAVIDAVDWWGAPLHTDAVADRALRVATSHDATRGVPSMLNRVAADSSTSVVLHTAAIATNGAAVLLPGPPGAGKSTLTAALVARGWRYLSDEAVGVRSSLEVIGYPKRLTLEIGAWSLFEGLADDERAARPGFDPTRVRWVDPRDLHPAALEWRTEPDPRCSLVVAATYRAGSQLAVRRLDPVDALTMLLANDFNLPRVGARGLDTLRRVAAETPLYEVAHGDLDDAVHACEELADREGLGSVR